MSKSHQKHTHYQSYSDLLPFSRKNLFCITAGLALFSASNIQALEVTSLERASVSDAANNEGSADSYAGSVSPFGRFVTFRSKATNLSTPPGNATYLDVFIRESATNSTRIVSVNDLGVTGNGDSGSTDLFDVISSSVTENGAFVVFPSKATNLLPGGAVDTNGAVADIFLKNMLTNEISLISRHTDGSAGNDVSREPNINNAGRYVVYSSLADNLVDADANAQEDIFMFDRIAQTTTRISENTATNVGGNAKSWAANTSVDGRFVVFNSSADNLVVGDNNAGRDVFLYDRDSDSLSIVSLDNTGAQRPDILIDNSTETYAPSVSDDGRYVVFEAYNSFVAEDTDAQSDIYLRDTLLGTITLISKGSWVFYNTPNMSGNAQYISFDGMESGVTTDFSNPNWDIFLYEVGTGEEIQVSQTLAGAVGNDSSWSSRISHDGKTMTFNTRADNLDARYGPDGNVAWDVMVASLKGSFPVLIDDRFTVSNSSSKTLLELTNDYIPDSASSVTSFTQPSSGTLVLLPDNTFEYTPVSTFQGTVTFDYTVCDSFAQCDTATVTVLVIASSLSLAAPIPSSGLWGLIALLVGIVGFTVRRRI